MRANLVSQYNGIMAQITTTAQDASFNGVNLLAGDTLKLTFNETGKSNPEHHRRQLQLGRPRPLEPHQRRRLHRQRRHQQGHREPFRRQHLAAVGSLGARLEPVDRADPPGLLEEPDQRAADRLVQPDAGRHQRGSGQQPGRCRPASRSRCPRCRWPTSRSRACSSCSAKLSGVAKTNDRGGGGQPRRLRTKRSLDFMAARLLRIHASEAPKRSGVVYCPRTLEKEAKPRKGRGWLLPAYPRKGDGRCRCESS